VDVDQLIEILGKVLQRPVPGVDQGTGGRPTDLNVVEDRATIAVRGGLLRLLAS
jgi:hypothetical protein